MGLAGAAGLKLWACNHQGSDDSAVKNPPAMQEMLVQSLGGEDSLEKGMATHSSTLIWEIPWTEKPGGLQSMGLQKNQTQLCN